MARVEYLEFRVTEGDQRVDPPLVELENSVFRLGTAGSVLRFTLKRDFQEVNQAEAAVGEFLRSFQAQQLLQLGSRKRDFQLSRGVDSSGRNSTVLLSGRINVCGPLADANYREQHPWEFVLGDNPLANGLARRFESYLAGKEPLVVVGYFVMTALEHSLKGRPGVAKSLKVSSKVLERFSLLVSSVGTLRTARKVSEALVARDLSEAESFWLERVIVELVNRFEAVAAGRQPAFQLTNAELPPGA